MKHLNAKKGFTLIEILVVVIIIGIISTFAIMYFNRAIERTRAGEAENLIGLGIYAQGRQMMRQGHYTLSWARLDAMPRQVRAGSDYLSDDFQIYYTKGGAKGTTEPQGGYKIYFQNLGDEWFVVAERIGSFNYGYTLLRNFKEDKVYCLPTDSREDGLFCADFMGLDSPEEIPADPRLALQSTQDD